MLLRLSALAVIWAATSIAWAILGTTIFTRTYSQDNGLRDKVESAWGSAQAQAAPSATYTELVNQTEESVVDGKRVVKTVPTRVTYTLPLTSSRVRAHLDLDHRQKGLLWYSTYRVNYGGTYTFVNDSGQAREVSLALRLPAEKAIYDDLVFEVDGRTLPPSTTQQAAAVTRTLAAGASATLKVGYRSQGLDSWTYRFGDGVSQVRDFALTMTTNFRDIDFPENALSPTEKRQTHAGWQLDWRYRNLLSGYQIAMVLPQRLQPGPLAGQISYFAPVSLLFFFFVIFILTTLRGIHMHPMNYFFLATAFFAFHLLLAYTVDHLDIHVAFVLSSLVSIFLVVTYLRLVVGTRFALREAALAQFLYLVLFSYAFFFKGFTGLAVTVGAILTLFVAMQLTGRIRWEERFGPAPRLGPTPEGV